MATLLRSYAQAISIKRRDANQTSTGRPLKLPVTPLGSPNVSPGPRGLAPPLWKGKTSLQVQVRAPSEDRQTGREEGQSRITWDMSCGPKEREGPGPLHSEGQRELLAHMGLWGLKLYTRASVHAGLNFGCQTCVANALTHWAISLLYLLIIKIFCKTKLYDLIFCLFCLWFPDRNCYGRAQRFSLRLNKRKS